MYAIIYLENIGLLSLTDAVTKYIPWFEATYQGENIAEKITIEHLLYHSSGYTNNENKYTSAAPDMELEEHIRNLSGKKLAFSPGEYFAYANANYNILGHIIECITEKSYADFMQEEIFSPLSLNNTYASPEKVSENLVKGTRLSFSRAWEYELPVSKGNVPAGYIVSCTKDLNRWLQLQIGLVEVPNSYAEAVGKAHSINANFNGEGGEYYAAGWFVNSIDGTIHHSGGTANYSSRIVIDTESGKAACVLANMNASFNTDDMASNLLKLLQGNNDMTYRHDVWKVLDTIFFAVTIIFMLLSLFVAALFIFSRKRQKTLAKGWYALPVISALFAVICTVIMPIIFAAPWKILVTWAPHSILSAMVMAVVFTILFIVLFRKRKNKKLIKERKNESSSY